MPSKKTTKATSSSSSSSKPGAPKVKSKAGSDPKQKPLSFASPSTSAGGISASGKPLKSLSSFKPSFAAATPSPSASPAPSPAHKGKGKGKSKAEVNDLTTESADDHQLWSERYEPVSRAELAIHARKIKDVETWLNEALDPKLAKYRRILVLTGTAGAGKTATVQVLAKEMGLEVVEWTNGLSERFEDGGSGWESLSSKFTSFLSRSTSYSALSLSASPKKPPTPSGATPPTTGPSTSSSSSSAPPRKKQLILVEDLPNVLESTTRQGVHAALRALCSASRPAGTPVVLIVSDSGTRGTGGDANGGVAGWAGKDVVDARLVVPTDVLDGPYCRSIQFNPIARTILKKHLNLVLARHLSHPGALRPPPEAVDLVVETANGDIRSALNALQFVCHRGLPGSAPAGKTGKKKVDVAEGKKREMRAVLEAVTRREQALGLFHSLGKVLYNKREGDANEEEPPLPPLPAPILPLPEHLSQYERRRSRVDPNALYTDVPVDTSFFSLYLHQNYPPFCDDVDEAWGVMDALSSADYLTRSEVEWTHLPHLTPYAFHLVTRGMLMALPSPVPRRSQKQTKPRFWDVQRETRVNGETVAELARGAEWSGGQQSAGVLATEIIPFLGLISPKTTSLHPLLSSLAHFPLSTGIAAPGEAMDEADAAEDAALAAEEEAEERARQRMKVEDLREAVRAFGVGVADEDGLDGGGEEGRDRDGQGAGDGDDWWEEEGIDEWED